MLRTDSSPKIEARIHLFDWNVAPGWLNYSSDPGQHRHGFDRIAAHRRLAGEHHTIGPVEDRVRYVGRFSTRGKSMAGHRFQHLRGGDDRLGSLVGAPHEILLHHRYSLDRHLHSQVATSDHDAVGLFQNLVDVVQSTGPFDLGDNEGLAAKLVGCLPYGLHICGTLDEGLADRVHAMFQSKSKTVSIVLGESPDAQVNVR